MDRQQFIQVNDLRYSLSQVTVGALQRSISGPVLFNLYVCDIQDIVSANTIRLQFVDDTKFYGYAKGNEVQNYE